MKYWPASANRNEVIFSVVKYSTILNNTENHSCSQQNTDLKRLLPWAVQISRDWKQAEMALQHCTRASK